MKKLLLFFLLLPATIFAQVPDPKPGTYINDLAGVLTDYQESKINERVYLLEQKYSVQLAIVLIGDLPANIQIEDYAREIGRKWHVGNARNGLVYVAVINQHKQRLEVAEKLEGIIPDITAEHLTDHIKPYFRDSDYAGGLLNMIGQIDNIVNPEAQELRRLTEAESQKKAEKINNLIFTIVLWLIGIGAIVAFIVWLVSMRKKKAEPEEPVYKPSSIGSGYRSTNVIAPVIVNNENNYSSGYSQRDDDYRSRYSSGSSSSESSSSSSDYGNWGSGSSDSSSSYDSGFTGGGSSNDW